jgi:hypothetical protein
MTRKERFCAARKTALPDGGFLRQSWKILADLKVVWQAKNISGGLPISGGFLVDLTNFAWVCFCLADSGGFGVSVSSDFYIRSGGFEKNHLATLT